MLGFDLVLHRVSLGRMGNNKQALQLIIQEEGDVEKVLFFSLSLPRVPSDRLTSFSF